MTFFNTQEDDPMIPSADFGDSKGRVYKLFKNEGDVRTLWKLVKNWFIFILAE